MRSLKDIEICITNHGGEVTYQCHSIDSLWTDFIFNDKEYSLEHYLEPEEGVDTFLSTFIEGNSMTYGGLYKQIINKLFNEKEK